MDKNSLCEAMYALPGSVVVKRRKSLWVAAVLLLAGAGMIVMNNLYGAAWNNDARSALVFTGGVLAIWGAILAAIRLFGSEGAPYHSRLRCYLLCDELRFGRELRGDVLDAVDGGDVERLLRIRRAEVPALTVTLYRTPDNRFAALQVYEYADLEYRPLTDPRIVGAEVK